MYGCRDGFVGFGARYVAVLVVFVSEDLRGGREGLEIMVLLLQLDRLWADFSVARGFKKQEMDIFEPQLSLESWRMFVCEIEGRDVTGGSFHLK